MQFICFVHTRIQEKSGTKMSPGRKSNDKSFICLSQKVNERREKLTAAHTRALTSEIVPREIKVAGVRR